MRRPKPSIAAGGGKTLLAAILFLLIVCPLGMIFLRAVAVDGRLNLAAAWSEIAQAENVQTIFNSLALGACVVALSTVIAAPLAWLFSRTELARRRWLDVVFLIPFMTPPYIASMGWILFMQKRGLFQQLFPFTGQWSLHFFSFFGLVLVMSLHVFPFMMTILKNAMRNIPSSLEESGAVFGARFGMRLRRIVLPLLSGNYAIGALLVFVKTLSEYGTPATLGRWIGFYVFTTDIHRAAVVAPIDFGRAASLSAVLVAICMVLWLWQNGITARKSYRLLGGKGVRVQPLRLRRRQKALAWSYVAVVLLLAIGVPVFSCTVTSLIKLRGYGMQAGNYTLQHYVDLFTLNRKGINALWVSLLLAGSSASIAAALGTAVALTAHGMKKRAGKALEAVSLLPEMLPGIVLVIGIMLFWNAVYRYVPLYNTLGMMVLAYTALFLPFTVQYVTSALTQLSGQLIWAGRAFGGTPAYVFCRITLPLTFKAIVSGWMMTFIIALRELVTASLIAPPNVQVISTYIMSQFDQGSVSVGMAMAVLTMALSVAALLGLNRLVRHGRAEEEPQPH